MEIFSFSNDCYFCMGPGVPRSLSCISSLKLVWRDVRTSVCIYAYWRNMNEIMSIFCLFKWQIQVLFCCLYYDESILFSFLSDVLEEILLQKCKNSWLVGKLIRGMVEMLYEKTPLIALVKVQASLIFADTARNLFLHQSAKLKVFFPFAWISALQNMIRVCWFHMKINQWQWI